jgi:type IV secretion system protein VirB10
MNDDSEHNLIESDDPLGRQPDRRRNDSTTMSTDRGMPALGQYRSARPRVWWLTPIAIVMVVGAGAVWTVHGFLARHDAEAKARRDSMAGALAQGRTFRDTPASAVVAVSTPAPASAVVVPPVPASVVVAAPGSAFHAAGRRSYYDASLLASGDGREAATGILGVLNADSATGAASSGATAISSGVATQSHVMEQSGGTLAQALTPTVTPSVRATMLGDRGFILAQGAKINCVGDTAFDSTEAGISTCTVTKNVYSDDGHVVLIERGSQINSEYRSNMAPGQKRVFVLSARIKTPNGVTVEVDSPVADALGRMGIDGYVDNHWGQRIGSAMLLGVTQDAIGYLATRGGNSNGSVVFENTQQQGNDMATRVLDSTINIPPTLIQNQGAEFTIVIARDLDFGSVYKLHAEGAQ